MGRNTLLHCLAEIEQYLALSETHVSNQEELIAELDRDGHDTTEATAARGQGHGRFSDERSGLRPDGAVAQPQAQQGASRAQCHPDAPNSYQISLRALQPSSLHSWSNGPGRAGGAYQFFGGFRAGEGLRLNGVNSSRPPAAERVGSGPW
jgi:hypothetical protein